MHRVHILTAVSRPQNLARLARSLSKATEGLDLAITWHWRFDLSREFVGGQKLKNDMLHEIRDLEAWIYLLDDDTLVHPRLFKRFIEVSEHCNAVVVSQKRTSGQILQAALKNIHMGGIDAGQVILKRGLIGNRRIQEHYCGDGEFFERILKRESKIVPNIVFLDEVLSYHNKIGD